MNIWKCMDLVLLFSTPISGALGMHYAQVAYSKGHMPFLWVVINWVMWPLWTIYAQARSYDRLMKDRYD